MSKLRIENKKYSYWDSVKITIRSSKILATVYLILTIISAILPTYQVIINAKFLDAAVDLFYGKATKGYVYANLAIVILVIAYQWLVDPIKTYIANKMEKNLRVDLRTAIVEKRSKLEYKYIEDSKSMDLINRVSENVENKLIVGFTKLLSLISLIVIIAGLLVVLVAEVAWLTLLIIVVAIPLLYLSFVSGRATYQANKEITKYQRKYKYLSKVMTDREAVDERTLFDYNKALNEEWFKQYEISRKMELKTRAKWFIKLKSGSVVTACISIFIAAVLIHPVVDGVITIGMFFSLINAAFELVHTMSWNLTSFIEAVSDHIEYLKELTIFSGMEQKEDADALPVGTMPFESLEFKNVAFRYPGTDKYILKDLSLKIEEGKHYAFVGANGAGKTTITKLLTGLYQEYEGEIFINGKELREYSSAQLKSFFSVVYQDFAKYSVTVKDNISLGNVDKNDKNVIKEAIELLKLDEVIQKLPQGVDTLLGKLKQDGKDISGGEWQRIALARCFVSQSPIRILDEPTAALDPIAESNLYQDFSKLCKGRTTIFFSHRLGSIKLADYIYVIDGGCAKEEGTHEQLMNQNGLYHTMYDSQRRWYQ